VSFSPYKSCSSPPLLVCMAQGSGSTNSSQRPTKRPRLPQFRDARPRKSAPLTDTSSILSMQRSSAGNLKALERERRHQASAKEPSPNEDMSPTQDLSPAPELASVSESPLASTEEPQKLKRKRVNTLKVSSFDFG